MRLLDLLLVSLAVGLTMFTTYALGGQDPAAAAAEEAPPRNPLFRSIVLHHSATDGGSAGAFERNHRTRLGGLAYHFIIGNGSGSPDGGVETGYRWRDQIPGPHTKNQAMNQESIAVCLVGDLTAAPPTRRQVESLVGLLERLCRENGIPAGRIYSHREVDPQTLCPGKDFPAADIRAALARRLK
jgi:N-acetyl-anhydromuramyl-L-alanine amidase AmpD